MLFKKRSTSSEGCPEKFGRSSNRALRAFANSVESAIGLVFEIGVRFGKEVERDNLRDEEFVMITCESNSTLFFLSWALVPVAVFVLLQGAEELLTMDNDPNLVYSRLSIDRCWSLVTQASRNHFVRVSVIIRGSFRDQ